MWSLFVVLLLSLCLEGLGFQPVYKQQFEDVMRYHRSINRFYQDWLDNSYHEANLTVKQKAYYNSLLAGGLEDRSVVIPSDLELFHSINDQLKRQNPMLLGSVMKLFQHLESDLDQYLSGSHRARRDVDPDASPAEKRKQRQEMKKEIKAQGKKAWRDFLKQQRKNKEKSGKYSGSENKDAKNKKWQRKMENRKGNQAPPTNEVSPPVDSPVAAPPPPPGFNQPDPNSPAAAPPNPPFVEETPKEAIPRPNPEDEQFLNPNAPAPPNNNNEKPNEDNKPQDPANEVKQFEGPPPPPPPTGNNDQPGAPPPPPSGGAPPNPNPSNQQPDEDNTPQDPNNEVKQFENQAPPPPGQTNNNPDENNVPQDPGNEVKQFEGPPPPPPPPGNNQQPGAPPPAPGAPPLPEFKEEVNEDIQPNGQGELSQFETRRRKRSLVTRRPEYNHLSETDYKKLVVALQQLLRTQVDGLSQYDVFVKSHRLLEAPQAYSKGDSYLWNKHFIQRFEAALRQYDSSLTLPYLDICSIIKDGSPRLLRGLPDHLPVIKECSWIGTTLKRSLISSNITSTKLSDLLGCGQTARPVSTLSVDDFASIHSLFGECVVGGSHLACPSCAVADPLYWLIYADLDRILSARNT